MKPQCPAGQMCQQSTATETWVVYLLHFDRPYRHARHYTGTTADLDARLAEHAAGRGARLLEVLRDNGIGWHLARTWTGGRIRERQLKRTGGASRYCPECGVRIRGPRFVGSSRAEARERARSHPSPIHARLRPRPVVPEPAADPPQLGVA